MKLKKCIFCEELFEYITERQQHCKKPECRKAWNRLKHQERRKNKTCKKCGKIFSPEFGESNEYCSNCRSLIILPKIYNTYIQQVKCRQCGKILETNIKNLTHEPALEVFTKTCEECKQLNNDNTSYRMRINNPGYRGITLTESEYFQRQVDKEIERHEKQLFKEDRIKEARLQTSYRMKFNNPMHNTESKQKALNTVKLKNLSKNHDQEPKVNIRENIRSFLGKWRKLNLDRANYTCEICGTKNVPLQVHHKTIKYKDIFYQCCRELNIKPSTIIYHSEDYYKVKEAVLNYHFQHPDLGLVVCDDCHKDLDLYYKKKKGL